MPKENICLISRSIYPKCLADHSQNILTFNGWLRFWDTVTIIAQNSSNRSINSSVGNIYGFLLPSLRNRYLNFVLFNILAILKIYSLNKKSNFKAFQASDAGAAFAAYFLSRVLRKKFIFEVQGDIFNYPGKVGGYIHSSLVKTMSRLIVKRADYIRIVSPFLLEPILQFGVERKKIFLVPPRCDSNLFNKKNVRNIQEGIFHQDKFNFIFIGNLLIAKGVDYLIEAFNMALKEDNRLRLIMIGDGIEKKNLIKRINELNIEEYVHFCGRVDYNLIPSYLYYSDALVLPSIEEGVGRVIIESFAMKTPVIASNVGGIPLVIDDHINGLLFEPEDTSSLKKKMLYLKNNISIQEKFKDSGYQKFKENFDYEVSMKKFLEMYKVIFN